MASVLEITSEIIVEISAIKIFTLYVLSLVTAFAENNNKKIASNYCNSELDVCFLQ